MAATTHSNAVTTDLAVLDALDAGEAQPVPRLRVEDVYREHFAFAWRSLRHLGVAEPDAE